MASTAAFKVLKHTNTQRQHSLARQMAAAGAGCAPVVRRALARIPTPRPSIPQVPEVPETFAIDITSVSSPGVLDQGNKTTVVTITDVVVRHRRFTL